MDKFKLVVIAGSQDSRPSVREWSGGIAEQPGLTDGHVILGVSMTDADIEEPVAVMRRGYLRSCPAQNSETWSTGDVLWAKSDGSITKTRPNAPATLVVVGSVFADEGGGLHTIAVDVQVKPYIGELSGVSVETPENLDVLIYNAAGSYWEPRRLDHGDDISGLADGDDHPQYRLRTEGFARIFMLMGAS